MSLWESGSSRFYCLTSNTLMITQEALNGYLDGGTHIVVKAFARLRVFWRQGIQCIGVQEVVCFFCLEEQMAVCLGRGYKCVWAMDGLKKESDYWAHRCHELTGWGSSTTPFLLSSLFTFSSAPCFILSHQGLCSGRGRGQACQQTKRSFSCPCMYGFKFDIL